MIIFVHASLDLISLHSLNRERSTTILFHVGYIFHVLDKKQHAHLLKLNNLYFQLNQSWFRSIRTFKQFVVCWKNICIKPKRWFLLATVEALVKDNLVSSHSSTNGHPHKRCAEWGKIFPYLIFCFVTLLVLSQSSWLIFPLSFL